MKCLNCGHDEKEHIIGVQDLHQYAKWDECKVKIKKGKATYQCNCQDFKGGKRCK